MEIVYHGDFPKKKRRARQNPRPSTRLGKFEAETVYHGDREETRDRIDETFRIGETIWIGEAARPRPTQNSELPSLPPDFQGNAGYHGDSPEKSGNHAKAHDSRTTWGNSKGNPFIMAIPHEKAAIAPKPATRVGKFPAETVYHGDHALFRWRSCQNWRPVWENSKRNRFIMAIAKKRAIGLAKPFGLAKSRELAPIQIQNHLRFPMERGRGE